jgi:hypothetical protein
MPPRKKKQDTILDKVKLKEPGMKRSQNLPERKRKGKLISKGKNNV